MFGVVDLCCKILLTSMVRAPRPIDHYCRSGAGRGILVALAMTAAVRDGWQLSVLSTLSVRTLVRIQTLLTAFVHWPGRLVSLWLGHSGTTIITNVGGALCCLFGFVGGRDSLVTGALVGSH